MTPWAWLRAHLAWPVAALAVPCLVGCAGLPAVQAWEKGHLARPDMALEGNALEAKLADHIYFSKEAASGGAGVAGGGCGCN